MPIKSLFLRVQYNHKPPLELKKRAKSPQVPKPNTHTPWPFFGGSQMLGMEENPASMTQATEKDFQLLRADVLF